MLPLIEELIGFEKGFKGHVQGRAKCDCFSDGSSFRSADLKECLQYKAISLSSRRLTHFAAQVPQRRGPKGPVCVRIGLGGRIEIFHTLRRRQAAGMAPLRIMFVVPCPDMGGFEHDCNPIVGRSLVQEGFDIALTVDWTKGIGSKIGGVSGQMMTIFVIDDAGNVGGVGTVTIPCKVHKRSLMQELSPRAQMNLPVGRNRIPFGNVMPVAGKPVVPALKSPVTGPPDPIAYPVPLLDATMGANYSDHLWKRGRSQLLEEAIDIAGHPVKMVIDVCFSKTGCLDVTLLERGVGVLDLVHAPAPLTRFKEKIPLSIRLGIPNGSQKGKAGNRVPPPDHPPVDHADVRPNESCTVSTQAWKFSRDFPDMATGRRTLIRLPFVDNSQSHGSVLVPPFKFSKPKRFKSLTFFA